MEGCFTLGGRNGARERCFERPFWGAGCCPAGSGSGKRQAMVQRKRVPKPIPPDSAHMRPPMASASFWLIARPSPDPP